MRALIGIAALTLALGGCAGFTHPPGISREQQGSDLERCRLEAKVGTGPNPVVPGLRTSSVAVASSAVDALTNEVENYGVFRRTVDCMERSGYQHIGATFRGDGWQPDGVTPPDWKERKAAAQACLWAMGGKGLDAFDTCMAEKGFARGAKGGR